MNTYCKWLMAFFGGFFLMLQSASAGVVTATFNAVSDVPVTAASYTATGNTVEFGLNFAPPTGTTLTVVKNSGVPFIQGNFTNLAQGQLVNLSFGGVSYSFVANYFGGSGNDLTLQWANNRLLGWGGNTGDGTTANQLVPVPVIPGALAGKSVIQMAAGNWANLAMASDGTLAGWGSSPGNGTTSSTQPVLVDRSGVLAGKSPIAIATGSVHTLVLCKDGTLAVWGDNSYGQLGNGSTTSSNSPVATPLTGVLAGKTPTAIAGGDYHTMVLCSDGTLATWGRNDYGQLGNGIKTNSSVPVLVNRTGVLSGKTVSAISCGGYTCLVLCTDGTLVSWGYNAEGELGNGTTAESVTVPVLVTRTGVLSGKTVTAISAGGSSSVVLCSDGTLASWGFNSSGQLGNGNNTQSTVPVLVNRAGVLSGKTVTSISCGDSFVAAVCADGTLASWGSNFAGRLGNNGTANSNVPVRVNTDNLASGEVFAGVDCGFAQSIALAALPPASVATTLAATAVRNSTVTLNGTASGNGSAVALSFEYGITTAYGKTITATPATLPGSASSAASADLTGLIPGATYHFRLVATSAGGVTRGGDQTFTTNANAVLTALAVDQGTILPGFASGIFQYELVVPYPVTSVRFTPVAAAGATVRVNGGAVASGAASAPVALAVGSQSVQLDVTAADGVNTCTYGVTVIRRPETFTFNSASEVTLTVGGFKASGPAQFGLNFAPAVGTNLTVVNNTGLPFIQGNFDNLAQGQVVNLSFEGVSYSFVANYFGGTGNDLTLQWANSRLVDWGYNDNGQLGNNTTTFSQVPVPVDRSGALAGKTLVGVSFGGRHQLACCSDGTVVTWGDNTYGQLGTNTQYNSRVPVAVDTAGLLAGRKVIAVSAGYTHSLVLCSDGRVAAWGENNHGELGTKNGGWGLVDVTGVLAGRTVVAITAGFYSSLALCSDGALAAWGYSGQLGNNATNDSPVPVAVNMTGVLAGKKVISIQSGYGHSLVLCEDGTLVAWGSNESGQLGTGGPTYSEVPVLVNRTGALAGKTVTGISAKFYSNLVTCSDGTLVAWGRNSLGELGTGSTAKTPLPVAVTQIGVLAGKSIASVATGSSQGFALCQDQTMAAWGRNEGGQLGNNTRVDSLIPVRVDSGFLGSGETVVAMYGGNSSNGAIVAIPPSPIATTLAATGIADSTAVLGALVGGNGSDTTVSFEYGLTTAYGTSATAVPAAVTGTTPAAVSAAIGGLIPGATYHYRVVAKNSGGTVVGNDMAFTTTVFATLSALSVTQGELSPVFTPTRTHYSLTVTSGTTGIRLTPVAAFPASTVKVNGIPVASGAASERIDLPVGNSVISVAVTAADGVGTLSYTVAVTRLPAVFTFNSPTEVPVTADDFTATGTAAFALNHAPAVGANLTVVNNTGYNLNRATFGNLAQGQKVSLTFGGVTYPYVANYFGGTGNDLVLQWSNTRLLSWGRDKILIPAAVNMTGVLLGKSIISLASGENHQLALCSDGTLAAWGYNGNGQLGNNSTTESAVPVKVDQTGVLAGKTVIAMAAGSGTSFALCSDGTIASWGRNFEGQLGNGNLTTSMVPIGVSRTGILAGKTVRAISAGTVYCMALCTDGTLVWWGSMEGSTPSNVPVPVNQMGALFGKTVSAIAAGGATGLVLCSDGTLAAWGANGNGQLGSNFRGSSGVPVLVDQTGALSGKTIVAIEGGSYHFLVRSSGGTVASWGDNQRGQLGINSNSSSGSSVPVPVYAAGVLAGKSITAVDGGVFHTLALCSDGTMVSWGDNSNGQLGNNNNTQSLAPVLVNSTALRPGERVTAISGGSQSLAIVASPLQTATSLAATAITGTTATLRGTVNANNNAPAVSFEYGLDTSYGSTSPATPPAASGNGPTEVRAELSGLTPGTTYHFRVVASNYAGDAKGSDMTFTTLSDNAKLAALGLSTGTLAPTFEKPTTAYVATVPFATSGLAVTPTSDHPGATVKVNGTLVGSGAASVVIALPVGNTTIRTVVTAEDGITTKTYSITITRLPENFRFDSAGDVPVVADGFSTGGYPADFVLNYVPKPGTILTVINNTGLGFIDGTFGNLAQGQRISLTYAGVTYDFVANYFGGNGNDLVLQWADTAIYSWGSNSHGQLGDNSTTDRRVPVAGDDSGVLAHKTIVATTGGYLHSLALCSDGTMAAWGYNIYGQLGNGSNLESAVPVTVEGSGALAGKTVVAISAGPFHNLALCSDGSVVAWGYNNYGQLGTGDKLTRRAPALVIPTGALTGKQVVGIAVGAYQSFARCADGSVVAWGYNDEGELGDNSTTTRLVPVAVDTSGILANRKVASLFAGQYHTLALCTDGTLVAWGYNRHGEVGDNSVIDRKAPVAIGSLGTLAGKTISSIAAGGSHTLALCSDGTLAAWGSNSKSQLGLAGIAQSLRPIAVDRAGILSGKTILRVAAGAGHTMALCADGTLAAWGDNSSGQLGNDPTETPWIPSQVDPSAIATGARLMWATSGSASLHSLAVVGVLPPESSHTPGNKSVLPAESLGVDLLPLGDDDHDGIANLMERAFGLDPTKDSSGKLPSLQKAGDHQVIEFDEPTDAAGIRYGVEISSTLLAGSWRDLVDTGFGRHHLFVIPADDGRTMFFRLKVSK